MCHGRGGGTFSFVWAAHLCGLIHQIFNAVYIDQSFSSSQSALLTFGPFGVNDHEYDNEHGFAATKPSICDGHSNAEITYSLSSVACHDGHAISKILDYPSASHSVGDESPPSSAHFGSDCDSDDLPPPPLVDDDDS